MAGTDRNSTLDTSLNNQKEDHSEQNEEERVIAAKESKAVLQIRMVVCIVLLLSTIAVACWMFLHTSRSEISAFHTKFDDDAHKVIDALGLNLDQTLGSFNQFAVTLASYAHYTNSSWPYVTHPDFALLAAKMLGLSKAFIITEFLLVTTEQRQEWENYTINNDQWIARAQDIQASNGNFHGPILNEFSTLGLIHNDTGIVDTPGPYLPSWQSAPVIPFWPPYNWNAYSQPLLRRAASECVNRQRVVISETKNIPDLNNPEEVAERDGFGEFAQSYLQPGDDATAPVVNMYYPLVDHVDSVKVKDDDNATTVGLLGMLIYWNKLISEVLPYGSDGMIVVFENTCNQSFTYELNGPDATYVGHGDLHDPKFDSLHHYIALKDLSSFTNPGSDYTGAPLSTGFCPYTVHLYPSDTMKNTFTTSNPATFTVIVVLIFAFTSAVFLLYDYLVERRQRTVMKSAERSDRIVSHLFPATVRDRLFKSKEDEVMASSPTDNNNMMSLPRRRSNQTDSGSVVDHASPEVPIADFFPEATVLIADISGFTAWSSSRSPTQVFTLLERLYGAFDEIARKRRVFKVETIGDSYVAVTGVPKAQNEHAYIMAKFARDMRNKMVELTRELEVVLGPDTGDLMLRIGIHSGPVTAGVLRGDRSRFQLFGDTINTASRMESTGVPGRIQVSFGTASMLESDGYDEWVTPRDELIEAKGKGKLQTFWLEPPVPMKNDSMHSGGASCRGIMNAGTTDAKEFRRAEWYFENLLRCLRTVVAYNASSKKPSGEAGNCPELGSEKPIDELKPVLDFQPFDGAEKGSTHPVAEDEKASTQLREYVGRMASLHNANSFHNFQHASHVAMSVVKLLTCMETATKGSEDQESVMRRLKHPLVSFSCIFSALIHDVSHPGVTNRQLIREEAPLAVKYDGKSVAEQNSIDTAWNLLMEEEFSDLRAVLCPTPQDLSYFRQIVVNIVLATDVMDKSMKDQRSLRWKEAFLEEDKEGPGSADRRATLVLEHLIQASDVSHTMQHWQIYIKWNERLFREAQSAYLEGRADQDPANYWYEGELKFFDFYVIPLAEKLSQCGVFGSFSDEYIQNAKENRSEWQQRGQDVVAAW